MKALKGPATAQSTALVARLDAWTRDDAAASALIPLLMVATVAQQDRVGGKGDKSFITGTDLVDALQTLYDRTLKPHCGGREITVQLSQISRFKYGELKRPQYPLALLFLLWLSERKKLHHPDSQASELLSVFNPVEIMEAHLRGEPLPSAGDASPDRPLLRGAMNRDIDAAERAVSEGLATLMGLERITSDLLRSDFFAPDEGKPCFLVYRRSTRNKLVKGFLVLEPPTARASDAHQFNHYHETSSKELRESRGFVLTLRNTHYFLGATGGGSRRARSSGRGRPLLREAVKCIVVNRDYLAYDGHIWAGLFLSHDQQYQPIAGRCVLVRSRYDTWQAAKIGLLELEDLQADLEAFAHPDVVNRPSESPLDAMAILHATDNSWETGEEPGGEEHLQRPLGIVRLSDVDD